ncbi:MAG: helix-turn-helix transcriptional regulator [Spirochaetes bacterium]|nr:helix-turn-helix transcriptional regulator [Spirochaetota bacterium]
MIKITDLLLIIAAVNGFFFSICLFSKKTNGKANRVFAILIFLLSLELIDSLLRSSLVRYFPQINMFFEPLPLLYGPLMYIYVVLATESSSKYHRLLTLSLLPFALSAVFQLLMLSNHYNHLLTSIYRQYDLISIIYKFLDHYVSGILLLFFCVLSLIRIKEFRLRIGQFYSETAKINLSWLKTGFITAAISSLLLIMTGLNNIYSIKYYYFFKFLLNLWIIGFIYICSFYAYMLPDVFKDIKDYKLFKADKYGKDKLPDKIIQDNANTILCFMKESKIFLEPDLTIEEFSKRININVHAVSQTINTHFNKNFFQFINDYRLETSVNFLLNNSTNKNILEIAMNSGFNSKATFNRLFRNKYGKPPSTFRGIV